MVCHVANNCTRSTDERQCANVILPLGMAGLPENKKQSKKNEHVGPTSVRISHCVSGPNGCLNHDLHEGGLSGGQRIQLTPAQFLWGWTMGWTMEFLKGN